MTFKPTIRRKVMFRQKKVLLVLLVIVNIFVLVLTSCNSNKRSEKTKSCVRDFPDVKGTQVCIIAPEEGIKQGSMIIQMTVPCGEAGQPPCQPPPGTVSTAGNCAIFSELPNKLSVRVDSCNVPAGGEVITTYNLEAVFKTPPR